jgi:putrescine transport system substrate-binding protein
MMRGWIRTYIRLVIVTAAALALPMLAARAQERTVNFYNWSN